MNFLVRIKSLFCFSIMFLVSSSFAVVQGMEVDVGAIIITGRADEDRAVVIKNLGDIDPKAAKHSLYAVYDGHGGSETVEYVAKNLHKKFVGSVHFPGNIPLALSDSFLKTDEGLKAEGIGMKNGTTAVVAVVKPNREIIIANTGDSRAILARRSRAIFARRYKVVLQTTDQKPGNSEERRRVLKAGGRIVILPEYKGEYVEVFLEDGCYGLIGMTRCLGSFDKKWVKDSHKDSPVIISTPDIYEERFKGSMCEFVVIASDGLWDMMDCEQVKKFVQEQLEQKIPAKQISKDLATAARNLWDTRFRKDYAECNRQYLVECAEELYPIEKGSFNRDTKEQLIGFIVSKHIDDITVLVVVSKTQ